MNVVNVQTTVSHVLLLPQTVQPVSVDIISTHQITHVHQHVLIIFILIHSQKHVKIVFHHVKNVQDHFNVKLV